MTNNWHTIWNNRSFSDDSEVLLSELIKIDGFDCLGNITEKAWRDYVQAISTQLVISTNDSLFEVGCGAGAFLYPFYKLGYRVGGIDYAEKLITIAKSVMPNGDFFVSEAKTLDTEKTYDFVVANSVFFYFTDYDYAHLVLQRMLEKAKKGIAILEIPDQSTQVQAIIARKQDMGDELYEQRYQGLDHLYFSRTWFHDALKNQDVAITIEQQAIEGYMHNPFRFNVFIKK